MFFLYDGLGSTRALTDETGTITDTYDYSAYGTEIDSTGITENSYRYTGEQFDANLNQVYLRARYYDPGNGRFTQQDTWAGRQRNPITLNKYLYANSNPISNIDPSGRFSLASQMAAISTIGILAASSQYSSQIGGSFAGGAGSDGGFTSRQTGWIILAAMAGAGSKLYDLIERKVTDRDDSTVDYYRAVDTGEMIDILDCNCFRFLDYGYGIDPVSIKRFWLGQSSAVTFGDRFIKGDFTGARESSFFVVKATVSQTADNTISARNGGTNPGDSFIGPGRAVGIGLLPLLNFEARRNGGIEMLGEY